MDTFGAWRMFGYETTSNCLLQIHDVSDPRTRPNLTDLIRERTLNSAMDWRKRRSRLTFPRKESASEAGNRCEQMQTDPALRLLENSTRLDANATYPIHRKLAERGRPEVAKEITRRMCLLELQARGKANERPRLPEMLSTTLLCLTPHRGMIVLLDEELTECRLVQERAAEGMLMLMEEEEAVALGG